MQDKKTGFTLIELLVVIAIIALLLAILIPGLRKAKEIAAAVVCLSNEKQLGVAFALFPQDNQDEIVDARPDTSGYVTSLANGKKYQAFVASPTTTELLTLDGRIEALRRGGLWQYLESHEVFNCPFDKRWRKPHNNTNNIGGFRSYSMGSVLSRRMPYNASTGEGKYVVTKYTQFISPSDKFVMIEENDNDSPFNGNFWNMVVDGRRIWYDPMAVVHNESSTFSYADGHSGKFKWTDKVMLRMSRGEGNIKWNDADPDSGDFELIRAAYIPGRT